MKKCGQRPRKCLPALEAGSVAGHVKYNGTNPASIYSTQPFHGCRICQTADYLSHHFGMVAIYIVTTHRNASGVDDANVAAVDADRLRDQDICGRLHRGDQGALRQLMDRYAPMVLRLAMNVLSDRGEAEDVVQEVFITVWKCRESWVGGGAKFSTWLYRVSINKAIDKRRSRRSRPESSEYITAACDALAARDTACEQSVHVDRADVTRKLEAENRSPAGGPGSRLALLLLRQPRRADHRRPDGRQRASGTILAEAGTTGVTIASAEAEDHLVP